MARPKTRGELKPLNLNIKADISNKLNEYAKETDVTKTFIIEEALTEYFNKHISDYKTVD